MKVLIAHASVGAGHTRAAEAILEALRLRFPKVNAKTVDVLAAAPPLFRKIYGEGYLMLARRYPRILGYLYRRLDEPGLWEGPGNNLRKILQSSCAKGFRRLLEQERPDILINTHFLPLEIASDLKRRGLWKRPQICVTTDFEAHRLWAHLPCEHFFAATEKSAALLSLRGVSRQNISVSGIPIHPDFFSARKERSQLSPRKRKTALLLLGGAALGPMEDFFDALLRARTPLEIIAICGKNETTRRRLEKKSFPARHRAVILGFTKEIPKLMAQSDFLITKPGGLTVSEALAVGVPILSVSPIPGQETGNENYIVSQGAARRVLSTEALPGAIDEFLKCPETLLKARDCALSLGRPEAAFLIAKKAVELALEASPSQEQIQVLREPVAV